ncbi:hypothetical protein PHMEG_00013977 [Phytophthora megakarya]|uniref:Uncharacterized protein n=1 Tax=Phytophthora megakarya TaxID=4795 RepID=A0A225W612_9STRA|nr:hypothetical protein PHMEG_00013977 [Phytophthora megakarya]
MPRSLPWNELGENLSGSEADKFLEAFRSYTTYKAAQGVYGRSPQNEMPSSRLCFRVVQDGPLVQQACMVEQSADLPTHRTKLGEHNADTRSPKGNRMTHMQKAFCREMAE